MNKYLIIFVVFVLTLSLAACGNSTLNKTEETSTAPKKVESDEEVETNDGEEEEFGPEEKAMMEKTQKIIDENSKKIPSDIAAIATVDGNLEGDIVLVNTQGGPMYELDTVTVRMILEESVGKTDTIIVNVHQQQTLNPDTFINAEITFDDAKTYDDKSVEDLGKVVKYFKGQGKTVYVFGMSFGAWMVQDLIVNEGSDIADRFFIANGRLDMPEEIWTTFSNGGSGYFDKGVTPVPNLYGTMEDPMAKKDNIKPENKNIGKLAAGLGYKRYSELLANSDLSNVYYLYGQTDKAVGRLSDHEVSLLKGQGATVVTYKGGHSAPDDKMKEGFDFLGIKIK